MGRGSAKSLLLDFDDVLRSAIPDSLLGDSEMVLARKIRLAFTDPLVSDEYLGSLLINSRHFLMNNPDPLLLEALFKMIYVPYGYPPEKGAIHISRFLGALPTETPYVSHRTGVFPSKVHLMRDIITRKAICGVSCTGEGWSSGASHNSIWSAIRAGETCQKCEMGIVKTSKRNLFDEGVIKASVERIGSRESGISKAFNDRVMKRVIPSLGVLDAENPSRAYQQFNRLVAQEVSALIGNEMAWNLAPLKGEEWLFSCLSPIIQMNSVVEPRFRKDLYRPIIALHTHYGSFTDIPLPVIKDAFSRALYEVLDNKTRNSKRYFMEDKVRFLSEVRRLFCREVWPGVISEAAFD
jgi:hypothetical protein